MSPVDKRVFDWIGDSRRNFCIAKGIQIPSQITILNKERQIVFSRAMNCPPNFEGALWFLDYVFPLVLEELPDVTIMIAGAMPDPSLVAWARSNVIVPGFVSDLNRMLAESALYVAPLVSGSGFKNKVVEALVKGTYVIETTFAVEFFEPGVRRLIIARDNPAEMANAICDFLKHPEAHADKLQQLVTIVRRDFAWSARTKELIELGELVRVSGTTKSTV